MYDKTLTKSLAEFVYELRSDKLERKVIEQAKNCILDYVGVSLFGSSSDIGQNLINLIASMKGTKESTIIGGVTKVPCFNAAFVNGALSHIYELDDGHRFAMGHPGAPVISAALSVAERIDATGSELLTAIIAGYEVFIRISSAINPSHFKRGFHTTGTCGTFGAAAAAGKLLGLTINGLTNALGIAGIQAAGFLEVTKGESMVKPIQVGRAAQSGVLASLLAESGITAPETILEGEMGFCRATSDNYNLQAVLRNLGKEYEIMKVYFKFYPSCRHTHPSIDAVLKLLDAYKVQPEEIARIEVRTYSAAYELCGKEYEPKSISAAKFSIPYCIAAAIIRKKVDHEAFSNDKIKDQFMLRLAKKVMVRVDHEIDKRVPKERGAIVEIIKKNGERYRCYVRIPYGEPENPASPEDLKNKFKILATKVISSQKVNSLLNLIAQLEKVKKIEEITCHLMAK
jgi:2-methylcitrate dehydratase PrpD